MMKILYSSTQPKELVPNQRPRIDLMGKGASAFLAILGVYSYAFIMQAQWENKIIKHYMIKSTRVNVNKK